MVITVVPENSGLAIDYTLDNTSPEIAGLPMTKYVLSIFILPNLGVEQYASFETINHIGCVDNKV
ncbi:MAG: hypothetical protein R2771_04215 [Saprospiraceae bacterium]